MINKMEISFSVIYAGTKKVKFSFLRGVRYAVSFQFPNELDELEYKALKNFADIVQDRALLKVDFAFNKNEIEFYFMSETEIGLEEKESCGLNLILDEENRVYLILKQHDAVRFAARLDSWEV